MIGAYQTIVATTSVTVQLTVTPLLAMRDLSGFSALLFYFLNDDPTNSFTALVETGEDSLALDAEFGPSLIVPPAASGMSGQRSLLLGPDQLRRFYRASATASGAPLAARWGLRGIRRNIQRWPGVL